MGISGRRAVRLGAVVIAATLLVTAAIMAVGYLKAASDSPDEFVIYFSQPVTAAQLRALGRRLSTTPGVVSVTSLETTAALIRFKAEMNAHPDDFVGQVEGLGPMSGALDVKTQRPWNLWATRQVVRSVEGDPAFQNVLGIPAPPGGWDTPRD